MKEIKSGRLFGLPGTCWTWTWIERWMFLPAAGTCGG